jgi:hypothetical protein
MVVVALAVLGGFWFVIVSPRHKQAQAAEEKLTLAQTRLDEAKARVTAAQVAKRSYASDYSTIAELGKAVPVDDEVPSLVFQLSSAADAHKIDFRSIKLSSAGAAAATAAAQAQPAPSTTTSTTTTPTTSTSTTPAAGGAAGTTATAAPATNLGTAALPPGAVVGPANFPLMPFSFIFDGSFFEMSSFLAELDRFTSVKGRAVSISGRLMTIDGISIKASRKGFPKINASVSANAFLLPADQGLTAGASASSPASASSTSSSSATPPTAAATPSR